MRFKPGVVRSGVDPCIWWYLPTAERLHFTLAGCELVVTSLRRSWGKGAHNPPEGQLVWAVDLRRWYLDRAGPRVARVFVDVLNSKLAEACLVLLEPEDLTDQEIEERGGIDKVDPHVHMQIEHRVFESIWL